MGIIQKIKALPRRITERIDASMHKYPRSYLAGVVILAILGYAYILFFPLLVIIGLVNTYLALTAGNIVDWVAASYWLSAAIAAALVSYFLIRVEPPALTGLTLKEEKAPELFNKVAQLVKHFSRPQIRRVVIDGHYDIDIVKTPKWALPVWSSNTLVIGLPVLQSLTAQQFECLLAARIGQFSKRDNPVTNWLYQLRSIWQQYRAMYSKELHIGLLPLRGFFALYAPFYTFMTGYAAQRDRLSADTYAMGLYNDLQVREMITVDTVTRWYLENQYWPAVDKIADIKADSIPTPHAKMPQAVHANVNNEKLAGLVDSVNNRPHTIADTVPSLMERIDNIGHSDPAKRIESEGTATAHFLGDSARGVIDLIDKLWLKTLLDKRKKQA